MKSITNFNTIKARWEVTYHREALNMRGQWVTVMDAGFISKECTFEDIRDFTKEMIRMNSNETSRYSNLAFRQYADWAKHPSLLDMVTKTAKYMVATNAMAA